MTKPFLLRGWQWSYFTGKTRAYLLYKRIAYTEHPSNRWPRSLGRMTASMAGWSLQRAALTYALWFACSVPVQAGSRDLPTRDVALDSRPNIVVLVADDWGFTDVGAFGGEIATPNIDALARHGVRFSNFHVAASCSPTRSMLLTGVDHHRNGVGNMRETIPQAHLGQPGYLTVLDRHVVTVANLLQDRGYRTYVTGKWHVGREPHNLPPARGFDHSLIQADSGSDNWETGQRYLGVTDAVHWYAEGRPARMPANFYSSRFFIDRLLAFLVADAGRPQPFFAYVGFQANHLPVQAPRAFTAHYRGRYAAGWEVLREARRQRAVALGVVPAGVPMGRLSSTPRWSSLDAAAQQTSARNMEVYAGMAEAMDFEVGRLVQHLQATGQYAKTVFVFLSDNGPEGSDPYANWAGALWLSTQYSRDPARLGEKGTYGVIGPGWATAAASPLAGYKFYADEGGVRVPLIVSGVPGSTPGTVHHQFAQVQDIVPTLLELTGTPGPAATYAGHSIEPLGGHSLLPVLQARATHTYAADEPVGYELSGNAALYKGDLKLVKLLPPVGDNQWHLYNLMLDPGETRDLRLQQPAAFRELQADYAAYAAANKVLPMPPGYEPVQQVLINAVVNVYLPRWRPVAVWGVLSLALLGVWWWWRRRTLPVA